MGVLVTHPPQTRSRPRLPCLRDAFVLELCLSFRIVEALVPRIGNRIPIGIESQEIESIIAVELTDSQTSSWPLPDTVHDSATVGGVTMTFVYGAEAASGCRPWRQSIRRLAFHWALTSACQFVAEPAILLGVADRFATKFLLEHVEVVGDDQGLIQGDHPPATKHRQRTSCWYQSSRPPDC